MLGSFQKNKKNLVAKFLVSHGKTLKLQLASYVLILFFLNQMLLLKDEIFKCTQHFHSIYFYIQKSRKAKKRKTNKTNKQTNKQKKCLVTLFQYTQIDSAIFNLQTQTTTCKNIEGNSQQFIYAQQTIIYRRRQLAIHICITNNLRYKFKYTQTAV